MKKNFRREDSTGNLTEAMGAQRNSPTNTVTSHQPLILSNAPLGASCSLSIDSAGTPRRRNALNADEHYDLIAETTQRRQKKSMSEFF